MFQFDMSQFMLAPMVVSQRLPLLWLESFGFPQKGRRESERMVTEKMEAVSEGMMAAQVEIISTGFAISSAVIAGQSPAAAVICGYKRMTNAAVSPSADCVKANFKRLSHKK